MPAQRELKPDRSARDLFGAKLRSMREESRMSLEGLASKVRISKSHLSRVEIAEYMPPPELPALLDELFEAGGIFGELYGLARKEIHPDKYRRRMELEAQAVVIREYSPQVVPGLLQTEEYARAQFRVHNPKASSERIEELVTARLARQALLLKEPKPDYSVILDEGVMLRSYGDASVMRRQLARLVELALSPTALVQVLPFSYGGHALVGGSLSLWTLDSDTQVAYEESISTGTVLERPDVVRERQRAYDLLMASALSPRESAGLLTSAMEALPDEQHP